MLMLVCLWSQEVMSGGVDRDVYVGHDAQHMRGVLTLKHPIRNGIVRNWDEMEMVSYLCICLFRVNFLKDSSIKFSVHKL